MTQIGTGIFHIKKNNSAKEAMSRAPHTLSKTQQKNIADEKISFLLQGNCKTFGPRV